VAAAQGLTMPQLAMGANFGDLDNDGYLDFYLGTGEPDLSVIVPNMMFLNRAGKGFRDVTMAGGFGHLQKGHGVAFADLDADGDQDVFQQKGGARKVDHYRDSLFENPGFGTHWIEVKLVGTTSNRSAIGARLRVVVNEGGVERSIYRTVGSGGSFGASPLRQHIGLGKAVAITKLEVFWPTTGRTQAVDHTATNERIEVHEDSAAVRKIALPAASFGS
jgi:hypothetical protein